MFLKSFAYSSIAFMDVLLSVVRECTDRSWAQAKFSNKDFAAYGSMSEEHLT